MIMINTYHQIMCLPSSRKASVVEEVLKNFEIFCLSIACSDGPEINTNRKNVQECVSLQSNFQSRSKNSVYGTGQGSNGQRAVNGTVSISFLSIQNHYGAM